MKRFVLLFTLTLALAIQANAGTPGNGGGATLKQQMDYIHTAFGVDFVYDGALKTDTPYSGPALKGLSLKNALSTLFKGTGISYKQKGCYIMLRKTDAKPEQKGRKPSATSRHTISGFVKDEGGEPLINATVYDTTTGGGTTTNAYGFYSLTLGDGRHQVRASYIGYEDLTQSVSLSADSRVDYQLHANATVKEVVVTGDMNSRVLTTQTGKRTLTHDDLDRGFSLLSSPDLVKTLQRTSGVNEGIELASGMYVHGGNDDENLFLLDGTPLYQINHCVGLFSAFNTDVIRNVDFYKSGFPARYSGRLSSVTDVRTKDGDMYHTHGSYTIGSMDGRFQIDGPIVKGRTSYNIGIRRTWSDLLLRPIIALYNKNNDEEKIGIYYFLHDINAKITHIFSPRSKMYLSLYSGMDNLTTTDKLKYKTDGYTDKEYSKGRLTWGNLNAALNWNYVFSPRLFANFSGVFTYNHSIFNYYDEYKYNSENGYIYHIDHHNTSKIYDTGVKADFDYRPDRLGHIRFGAAYTLHSFNPQTSSRYDYNGDNSKMNDTIRTRSTNHHLANELSLYAEDELRLSERWNINLGAHATMFAISGKTYFTVDPRAALKYQATESTSLKLSFTGMTQTVHRLSNTYLSMPTDYWVPTTERLQPMRSYQFAAGVYSRLSRRWFVSLEGYIKQSHHLLMYTSLNGLTPPAANWDLFVSSGRGRFLGVEFDASYKAGPLAVDAAYTLSWNERKYDDLYPSWFYDKFDSRHKINLTVHLKTGKRSEMFASWTGHTGNRVSMPSQYVALPEIPGGTVNQDSEFTYIYGKPNNIVLPFYHRLDVGWNTVHITKHGHQRVWNISLYNAYCQMNKLYADVTWDDSGQARLKAYGFIPILPSVSYTIKF